MCLYASDRRRLTIINKIVVIIIIIVLYLLWLNLTFLWLLFYVYCLFKSEAYPGVYTAICFLRNGVYRYGLCVI